MNRYISYFDEGLGSNNVGLPSHVQKKYKTFKQDIGNGEIVNITVSMKTWNAQFAGWNIDINGERIFKNQLDQNEAVESAIQRYKKNHGLV